MKSQYDKILYLILHNIRSQYNVGSIFRTADAAGVLKIYLTGYTPDPDSKTALGAENYIVRERGRIGKIFKKLRDSGAKIVALEIDAGAIDYRKFKPNPPAGGSMALILGNEVRGISKQILKKCDKIIYIPMQGRKESLNVSVAAGIAIFELVRSFRD